MSNTSTTDKVVVGGALVGGLLFFGFLTNTCTSPFSLSSDDLSVDSDAVSTLGAELPSDDPRVIELQKQMDALKMKNAELTELESDNDALRSEVVNKTKSYEQAKVALNR